jgi:hypothetical protein
MRSHAIVLLLLGLVSPQNSQRTPNGDNGVIAGVVVSERQEPVARAMVQAFPASVTLRHGGAFDSAPPMRNANGTAETDRDGRFRISGLALGEYVIAAAPLPSLQAGGPSPPAIYAATFYPSVIDDREATRVSASAEAGSPIQIELVRVPGARLSGSVVNPFNRPTQGMRVRLYHQFGDFGGESDVAIVDAKGLFEISRVPPGWYRLSIAPRGPESPDGTTEFAEKLIEVKDHDVESLAFVLGPGASIDGRIAVEGGASVTSGVGLRVSAMPTPEQYSASKPISSTVAADWSFHLNGPSGFYQFGVARDRAPFLTTTRISVDGVEASARNGVELVEGTHDVVVFVSPRDPPKPPVDGTSSSAALVEQFKSEKTSWRQFEIAKQIVVRHDASVLPSLTESLGQDDRHARGNAAFIFAGLGDPRGFQVITEILADRSDRPEVQGMTRSSGDGRYHLEAQIAADRYYAAHLLGDLRDPRAVPILVPPLNDREVSAIVPWSLGEIGDKRAIAPLIDALDDSNPSIRVLAIYALETLHAKEAVPRLIALLDDHEKSHFGAGVSVADAAGAAIAKLK